MKARRNLLIVGAGGFGREVLAWARHCIANGSEWQIKGFLDDNLNALDGKAASAPIIARTRDYEPAPDDIFVGAVGDPSTRRRLIESLEARGGEFACLRHPTAVLGDEIALAAGVILCPHVVVSGYSSLGKGVVVNFHSSVDHDATIGDYTQINCHCDITGGVVVGCQVFVGSHVTIAPRVTIGDRAYLGIGSVVLRDVPPDNKVFGVPARRVE